MKIRGRVIVMMAVLLIGVALLLPGLRSRWVEAQSAGPRGMVAAGRETEPLFVDVAGAGGVNAVLRSSLAKDYLPETVGGGVCLLDYDNDGYLDIYFVNGSSLERYQSHAPGYGKVSRPFYPPTLRCPTSP